MEFKEKLVERKEKKFVSRDGKTSFIRIHHGGQFGGALHT